jgi:hypothetical protein
MRLAAMLRDAQAANHSVVFGKITPLVVRQQMSNL